MSSGARLRQALAWAPLALLALAAMVLVGSTRAQMPLPLPGWLALAAGTLALIALHPAGRPRVAIDLPVAAVFGVGSEAAYLVPGLLVGNDTMHHLWGAWAYLLAWSNGDWVPVWLHHLGLGMPLPLFYGPLPFWAMAPFALTGGGPAHLLSGSFVLAGLVAAVSAWSAVAIWTSDRRGALVAAVAWSYAPYRLLDANYRIAIGETWALAVVPLVLVSFDRLLLRAGRRWFALAAVSMALVTWSHPLSLVLYAVALLTLFLARLPRLAHRGVLETARAAGRSLAATIAGTALAGCFALPLVANLSALNMPSPFDGSDSLPYGRHGIRIGQLLDRHIPSAMGWSIPEGDAPDGRSQMPFYLGLVLLAGLGGAVLAGPSRSREDESPLLALAVVGAVSTVLALRPLAHLLSGVGPIAMLQFPWRFLGPASAAAALALGCLVARPLPVARPMAWLAWLVASGLALAALGDGFARSGALARAEAWQGLVMPKDIFGTGERTDFARVPAPWPLRVHGVFWPPWSCCAEVNPVNSVYPQYFTPTAYATRTHFRRASIGLVEHGERELRPIDALPYARLWPAGEDVPRALEFQRAGGTIVAHLPLAATGRVEVAEQYFPGWQVQSEGRWVEVTATDDGLLQAEAPAGASEIRFRFHRWRWDRTFGWLLTLVTATWLGILLRSRRAD